MDKQNYSNHKKYYPPHHFIFLPLMAILFGVGAVNIFRDEPNRLQWLLFAIACFCILYLVIMLRQHYALGNQDRIIRLEFKLRYFELFGEPSKKIEEQISFRQLAALRFADDDEFAILLQRAIKENLSSNEIKKAIKNWQGDHMRV